MFFSFFFSFFFFFFFFSFYFFSILVITRTIVPCPVRRDAPSDVGHVIGVPLPTLALLRFLVVLVILVILAILVVLVVLGPPLVGVHPSLFWVHVHMHHAIKKIKNA